MVVFDVSDFDNSAGETLIDDGSLLAPYPMTSQ